MTLGQHAFERIFLIQGRQPTLQRRRRFRASGRPRGVFAKAIGRRSHLDLSAVRDDQPFIAGDVVGREALVEKVGGQVQRVAPGHGGRLADLHLMGLDFQGAATRHAFTAQLGPERQCTGP